jgi:hypothetical protein
LTIQVSPSRTALVRSPARSEPAEGSEKSWHQDTSPATVGVMKRSSCSGEPCFSSTAMPIDRPISWPM